MDDDRQPQVGQRQPSPRRWSRGVRPAAAVERLLQARRPSAERSLTSRERKVESVAAAAFVAACILLVIGFAPRGSLPIGETAGLILSYAALARVRFAVGSGFAVPTQLALVPILLLLPPAYAPALVALALILDAAPELAAGRMPPERLLSTVADGWYVVAPAVLLAAVSSRGALTAPWPLWLLALALQVGGDLLISGLREGLGSAVAALLQARVIAQVATVDVLLSPIGLLAALASKRWSYAFVLTLPLGAGLALFSRERASRISQALALVDEVERERNRVAAAQRRIGETAAANLNRTALEQIVAQTALELVGATVSRLRRGRGAGSVRARSGTPGELDDILTVAEEATAGGGIAEARSDHGTAIAVTVSSGDGEPYVLSVSRAAPPFAEREREVVQRLGEQAASALRNLALHDRVAMLATTDELTGLLNHRRFQEVLEREVRRARRYGSPLALLMLDIDNFKQVNDQHGHQRGDAVLRAVAGAIRGGVREVDLPARYGGEELAIVLPHMDLDGAAAVAERLRQAVATVAVSGRDGHPLTVTASLGVAELDPMRPAREALISAADDALYRAKHAGKNRVELADPRARRVGSS